MLVQNTPNFKGQSLAYVISEPGMLARVRSVIPVEYWSNDVEQQLATFTYNWFDEYGEPPSYVSLLSAAESHLIKTQASESKYDEYADTLHFLSNKALTNASDRKFVEENFEAQIRTALVDKALLDVATMREKGSTEGMLDTLTQAVNFKLNEAKDDSLELEDFNASEFLPDANTKPVPTGFYSLDNTLHGGIRAPQVGIIVGLSGFGKSQILINFFKGGLEAGVRVLYVSTELSKKMLAQRLYACVSGIDYWDLRNEDINFEAEMAFKLWLKKHKGSGTIKYYPPSSTTVGQYIDWYKNNGPYDLVLFDMADKFITVKDYGNDYGNYGKIYEEVVGFSGEYNVPSWVATQANREGAKAILAGQLLSTVHMSDSAKKTHVADFVFPINQTDKERGLGLMRLVGSKVRDGETGKIHYFQTHFEKSQMACMEKDDYEKKHNETNNVSLSDQINMPGHITEQVITTIANKLGKTLEGMIK